MVLRPKGGVAIMEQYTMSELLSRALEYGIIDGSDIQRQLEMNEKKKVLEEHRHKIYQGKDGNWYTYVDEEKGRRKIKKKDKLVLEDYLHNYYKKKRNEPTIQSVFDEWIKEKLEFNEIAQQTYDRYYTDFVRFFVTNPSFENFADRKIKYIGEEVLEVFIKRTIAHMQLTQKAYSGLRILVNGIFKYAKKKKATSLSITQLMGDMQISKRSFAHVNKNREDEV